MQLDIKFSVFNVLNTHGNYQLINIYTSYITCIVITCKRACTEQLVFL